VHRPGVLGRSEAEVSIVAILTPFLSSRVGAPAVSWDGGFVAISAGLVEAGNVREIARDRLAGSRRDRP
jgi:hypothetical protein